MTTPQPMFPKTIERLFESTLLDSALLAGMELDVFTPLKDGAHSPDAIARALGTHPAKTKSLLEALATVGLLQCNGGQFSNSAEAQHFLVRGHPNYIGMRHHAYRRRLNSLLSVPEAARTGKVQTPIDYAGMPANVREEFYRAIHTETVMAGRDLAKRLDLSRYRHLADIGGGSGGVSIALAEAWPDLAITIVDLPATKPVAERHLAEAGLSERIAVQGADVVAGAISGTFDVAVMRGLSLILTLDQLRKAFASAYRALVPGAPLYVVGWILDDSRLSPPNYVADNLRLASQYDEAQLHTEADHRALLSEVGFKDIFRDPVANVYGSDFIVGFKR